MVDFPRVSALTSIGGTALFLPDLGCVSGYALAATALACDMFTSSIIELVPLHESFSYRHQVRRQLFACQPVPDHAFFNR